MSAPTYSHGLANYLTDQQIGQLLAGIRPQRVGKVQGMSHVEAYDIRAHLTRVFGFGRWSQRVLSQELVFEDRSGDDKPRWTVCYRSLVELTVNAPDGTVLAVYTEGATGDAKNQPSRADAHDLALKTSQSQALKRAAVNLGDQFGLSLYNKGSMAPLVGGSHVGMPQQHEGDVTEHITVPLAPENGEPESPQRETSSAPARSQSSTSQVSEGVRGSRSGEASPAADTPAGTAGAGSSEVGEPPVPPASDTPNPTPDDAVSADLVEAERVLTETFGATPPGDDPLTWLHTEIAAVKAAGPADPNARRRVQRCMEVAIARQLRGRPMPADSPDAGKTVGVVLTTMLSKLGVAA